MKTKKGQMEIGNNLLVTTILTVFIVGFIAVISANFNTEIGNDFVTGTSIVNTSLGCNATARQDCGLAYNITVEASQGVENVTEKLDLVGLVGVMIFLLGLVLLVVRQFA